MLTKDFEPKDRICSDHYHRTIKYLIQKTLVISKHPSTKLTENVNYFGLEKCIIITLCIHVDVVDIEQW